MLKRFINVCLLAGVSPAALAESQSTLQHDPIAPVILWVTFIFFFALIGRFIAKAFNQPSVLGELLIGVFLGNLAYFFNLDLAIILREGSAVFSITRDLLAGMPLPAAVQSVLPDSYYASQVTAALSGQQGVDLIKVAYVLDVFARYGVIFLLFKVGLESSFEEMKRTGIESIQVAIIGVIAPILLGLGVVCFLMPETSFKTNLFTAATLSATSIGITASVLSQMKKLQTREAKIILGAAMLDDVLGLIILAVVSSIVISGAVNIMTIARIIFSALLFFGGILSLGPWVLRRTVKFFELFLEPWEVKLFVSFIFVMALAWIAASIDLATIIGAFAAGLLLHDQFFESKKEKAKNPPSIKMLIEPLESILAPLFFILIGIQVKLESFFDYHVLLVASGLLLAAIFGKLLSGLGANRKDNRLLIGIGMLPRGEVGLVFAAIGKTLGVMTDELFTAVVLMIVVTTILAPPLLKIQYQNEKVS